MQTGKPLEELVLQIFNLNEELYKLIELRSQQKLGKPAPPQAIKAVEEAFEIRLPEDYREFLLLHDGWRLFNGGSTLLSTREMMEGELHDLIVSLKQVQHEAGDLVAATGFVFEASINSNMRSFFDCSAKKSSRLDVVLWRDEELDRYPSFTAYLTSFASDVQKMVKAERRKFRK